MMQRSYTLVAGVLVFGTALGFFTALAVSRYTETSDVPSIADAPYAPASITSPPVEFRRDAPVLEPMVLPEVQEPLPVLPIMVFVDGAVQRPDAYRFETDRRVQDALDAAGGPLPEADLGDINIAAKLMDDTSLYIPYQLVARQDGNALAARRTASAAEMNPARYTRSGWAGVSLPRTNTPAINEPATGTAAPPSAAAPVDTPPRDGRINLNTASLQELQTLPGIGPKTAEKIIAYREERPFQRIEELMEVHGIADKKMEAVRDLVRVE